jgi:DnaK suppressor protein
VNESESTRLRAAIDLEQSRVSAQIANLQRSFDGIVDAAELSSNDDEHDPEGATIAYERAQVSALLNQAREDLLALDAALTRLADGTAGTCDVCDSHIAFDRLLALPGITTCIRCAT